MSRRGRSPIRAGWSRTVVPITPEMRVVDLGSGAFPHPRADFLCDRDLDDDVHRAGAGLVIDRPLVRADATELPFSTGSVDFLIVSHLAEHIADPDEFCAELARVAKAGYIETPSPLADYLLDEDYHLWRVGNRNGVLEFRPKPPKPAWIDRTCRRIYRVFYAGQPTCGQHTLDLPDNAVGTAARFSLRALGAILNRSGIMHTRVTFSPTQPLRWRVVE